MDRAIASGAIGREFESLRAHQISPFCSITSPYDANAQLFHVADGSIRDVAFPLHAFREIAFNVFPVGPTGEGLTGCAKRDRPGTSGPVGTAEGGCSHMSIADRRFAV